jgi:putative transposase
MMLDGDVLAVSPSTIYRVLRAAAKLGPRWGRPSKNAKGFEQPSRPHEHWHVDFFYMNIYVAFYFFYWILDGYSRCIPH